MLETKPEAGTTGARTADHGLLTTVEVGPLRVAWATRSAALELTDSLIHDGSHHFVCFCEANLLCSVLRDVLLSQTFRSADAICEQALVVCRSIGDRHGNCHALNHLGTAFSQLRNRRTLVEFLQRYGAVMPRTMLRYAIEKLPPPGRHR